MVEIWKNWPKYGAFLKIHEGFKTMKKANKDRSQRKAIQHKNKWYPIIENATEDKDAFKYTVYEDVPKWRKIQICWLTEKAVFWENPEEMSNIMTYPIY